MRTMTLLWALNEADLALDALKARLAQIAEALMEPAALKAARHELAQAEADLAACRANQEQLEARQRETAAKLARSEKRLYGGEVRAPKELEGAEKDVQQLRRQLAQVEDELLEALICLDKATQARDGARATVERLTADWQARRVVLADEQARLLERLPAVEARQRAARTAVPASLLPIYDGLRARRGGRAIAELDGDSCGACKVAVSPTRAEAARYGDELVYCENCGRLLWAE